MFANHQVVLQSGEESPSAYSVEGVDCGWNNKKAPRPNSNPNHLLFFARSNRNAAANNHAAPREARRGF